MCKAVDEALHMQRIHQPDCAHPEEALPSQNSSTQQRDQDDGDFSISPQFVDSLVELRTPVLSIRTGRLIQPARVCPPKPAMRGTGDILGRVGLGGVRARVMDPAYSDALALTH